ncbi:MAG: ABC transporter ATP-binding protein [Opitutales bacterium]
MIRVEGLTKVYKNDISKRLVLNDLSFELGESKSLAIMGDSGCGKSTLLNILGAVDGDFKGKVFIAGQDISSLDENSLADFRRNEIGFVFQKHYFLPQYNLLENVLIPTLGLEGDFKERAKMLLDKVGLNKKYMQYPSEVSGGELQRAALARALINSPKILLADEPTGALDSKNSQIVLDLINSIEGLTKILVTHSKAHAENMEDILVLEDGVLSKCSQY